MQIRKGRWNAGCKGSNRRDGCGLGGYTVVKELQRLLPKEDIIFLGDGKNQPYGNRSEKDILCLTHQCLDFLKDKHVKVVAVACNTISTLIDKYQPDYEFRIFSIVQAGSTDVIKLGLRQVGILSTVFTANSGCYDRLIHQETAADSGLSSGLSPTCAYH